VARSAFEVALSYARGRKQYGRPIIENQAISFMLADMATESPSPGTPQVIRFQR